jgi:hypothetical protein
MLYKIDKTVERAGGEWNRFPLVPELSGERVKKKPSEGIALMIHQLEIRRALESYRQLEKKMKVPAAQINATEGDLRGVNRQQACPAGAITAPSWRGFSSGEVILCV